MRYTNQIQQERRALQEEVERLKLRIEQLETLQSNEQVIREKFYEGAAWLGKDAVDDANTGLSYVKEQMQREYERKLEEAGRDDMLRQRVSHWVIDQACRKAQEVRDKVQERLEGALRNKAVA